MHRLFIRLVICLALIAFGLHFLDLTLNTLPSVEQACTEGGECSRRIVAWVFIVLVGIACFVLALVFAQDPRKHPRVEMDTERL